MAMLVPKSHTYERERERERESALTIWRVIVNRIETHSGPDHWTNLGVELRVKKHVLRLEISMDDWRGARMEIMHGRCHLVECVNAWARK